MNNQFKAGDLAVIVGANSLTQNIGRPTAPNNIRRHTAQPPYAT